MFGKTKPVAPMTPPPAPETPEAPKAAYNHKGEPLRDASYQGATAAEEAELGALHRWQQMKEILAFATEQLEKAEYLHDVAFREEEKAHAEVKKITK